MIPNFLELPDGSTIRTNTVTAIHPLHSDPEGYDGPIAPRVEIDYVCGESGNYVLLWCSNNAECDELAADLRRQVQGVGEV
jgi:hypothetical protein